MTTHTCILTGTTVDGRPPPPCKACEKSRCVKCHATHELHTPHCLVAQLAERDAEIARLRRCLAIIEVLSGPTTAGRARRLAHEALHTDAPKEGKFHA